MSREIGLFGGTFNPIHWGHLLIAESARDQLKLEKILFITSPNPPHRHTDIIDAEMRHRLVSAAVADNPNFEASRVELERSGPSYTIDTLRTLKPLYPDARLNLIIGEDNLQYLHQWHEAAEIFKLCRIVVAARAKQATHENKLENPSGSLDEADIVQLEFPLVPVSSSDIRRRLREKRSVLYLVPSAVNHVLLAEGLFIQ